jgi:hypothetical protein
VIERVNVWHVGAIEQQSIYGKSHQFSDAYRSDRTTMAIVHMSQGWSESVIGAMIVERECVTSFCSFCCTMKTKIMWDKDAWGRPEEKLGWRN